MEIILARHGPSSHPSPGAIGGSELEDWARSYDEAGLVADTEPPDALRDFARLAGCIVASDLPRSRESAALLARDADLRIEPLIREVDLPTSVPLPVRLPIEALIVLARVGWWLKLLSAGESIDATQRRAARATDALIDLADQHELVLVVGHGIFNQLLARELRSRGWNGPRIPAPRHWSTAAYRLQRLT